MRDLTRPTASVALPLTSTFRERACARAARLLYGAMPSSPGATHPETKPSQRSSALARRAEAHAGSRALAAASLARHGLALMPTLPGAIVSAFLPMRDEIDVLPLLQALAERGKTLALPVIETRNAPLIFRQWRPGDPMRAAGFGTSEPLPSSPAVLPDILLVPMAAFDSAGYRIGYGGGYYDRTLALYRATRSITAVGVAYDEQEIPACIREPHDQRLDYILTPSGVRRCGG